MQDSDLKAAVEAGILDQDRADALLAFLQNRAPAPETLQRDEERFTLFLGFSDIFAGAICALIIGSICALSSPLEPPLNFLLGAAAAWLLSEHYARRRKLALPSIVSALGFVATVAAAGLWLANEAGGEGKEVTAGLAFLAVAPLAGVAAFLHWWRFHVPIIVAAGTVATGLPAMLYGFSLAELPTDYLPWCFLGFGILLFAMAMRWDLSDRERRTIRADVAFWLHLAAAPLVVHPAFLFLAAAESAWQITASVLALYLALTLLALIVDRRAALLSGLGYVLYALSNFAISEELAGFQSLPLLGLLAGLALLALTDHWNRLRAILLKRLPVDMQNRLPVIRTEQPVRQ